MPVDEALQLVGLGDRMNHFSSHMPASEQQRVAIARAVECRHTAASAAAGAGAPHYSDLRSSGSTMSAMMKFGGESSAAL